MALVLPACKTPKLPKAGDDEAPEMPGSRTGFLPAKVAAYRHAMANMPEEDKRYGDEFYSVAAIHDQDASHVKVLVAALRDMHPPVVEHSQVYTRGENSKWHQGKPAIVWTSRVKEATDDVHVFIVIGWMHSNLLFQFYEYETRYLKRQDAWEVVDFKLLKGTGI